MSKHFLVHTIFLLLATTGTYLWLITPSLQPFTLQLIAMIILIFFLFQALKKRLPHNPLFITRNSITLDVSLLTITILLLVAETGTLTSPIFFLLYFLLFAVALLYEIEATLILTGVLIIFLVLLPDTNLLDIHSLSELLALIMITPLAIIAGHQHEVAMLANKDKIKVLKKITRNETDTLLFLSLNLKNTLTSAMDQLSLIIPQTKIITTRTNMQNLYHDLRALYKSSGELEELIDRENNVK